MRNLINKYKWIVLFIHNYFQVIVWLIWKNWKIKYSLSNNSKATITSVRIWATSINFWDDNILKRNNLPWQNITTKNHWTSIRLKIIIIALPNYKNYQNYITIFRLSIFIKKEVMKLFIIAFSLWNCERTTQTKLKNLRVITCWALYYKIPIIMSSVKNILEEVYTWWKIRKRMP